MESLSLGQLLRQERENKGLQLSDVQNATKIRVQNLEALEEGRFDAFPNRVYARAFLRDYANFLDLDSSALLDRYEEESGRVQQDARTAKSSERSSSVILGLAILVILVMVGLAFYRPIMSAIQNANRPEVVTPPPARPEPPKPEVPAETKPVEPVKPVPVEGVTLEAKALSATWMRVSVDGEQAYQGTMSAGQVMKWHGQKVIHFRTGNAGGVRLTLDGKLLPPLGKSGQVYQGRFIATSTPQPDAQPAAVTPADAQPAPEKPAD